MFERVLIALDGSETARRAGDLGLRLAARFESRAIGLYVVDSRVVEGPAVETLAPLWGEISGRPFRPEVLRAFRARADEELERFCRRAREAGCQAPERHVEIGVAEEVILEYAASADLVVMGRRGEHAGFGSQPLGATLSRVLHRTPHPVLVAGSAAEPPVLPLVAYDEGDASVHALDLAVRYATATAGELRLVHAGPESADRVLERAHAVLRDHGVGWESVRLDAEPEEAVAAALERWEADCLFMGAYGRGRLRDLLFGSRTEAIMERVAVPVFFTR